MQNSGTRSTSKISFSQEKYEEKLKDPNFRKWRIKATKRRALELKSTAFLAILEFNKLEKKQFQKQQMGYFSRSRGNQKSLNKADDYQKEYDQFEGNTGALGGVMNDSQTDHRSSAKRVKLMASKIHENELADYTSEDVDRTLFANNPTRMGELNK